MSDFQRKFNRFMFGAKRRLEIYESLASFMKQGKPLSELLDDLAAEYKKYSPRDARASILQEWNEGVRSGVRFSDAIAYWVPASERMLIRSGEQSGDPVRGLTAAILATGGVRKMIAAMRGNLAYSGVLLAALIGFIYFFSVSIIPSLADTVDPKEWRGSARTLYVISMAVLHYGMYMLAALVVFIAAVVYSMPRWTGEMRSRFDRIPPYSMYRTVQGSIFLISLASMMQSGTPIVSAIKGLRSMADRYTAMHLSLMNTRLDAGRSIGDSLNTGIFAGNLRTQVQIYGKLADFDSKLEVLGTNAIDDGIKQIEAVSKVLGQAVLVILGLYIGWVFSSAMGIIDQITSSASF